MSHHDAYHLSRSLSGSSAPPLERSRSITSTVKASFQRKHGIYERNLNRTRNQDINLSAFAFLFSEIVRDAHTKAKGIQDLEARLNETGYLVGQKVLELSIWREKNGKRETRLLGVLQFIHTSAWKALFKKPADALEKSNEHPDEYMIMDNNPMVNQFISVPKEMSQLNCAAFVAGIIESILDRSHFPCRVTAHSVPLENLPNRVVYLVKFDNKVIEREEFLEHS